MCFFRRILYVHLTLALLFLPLGKILARPGSLKPTTLVRHASIADFGAVGDGKTLNTPFIQTGIDQLSTQGGGTLVIPRGVFLSGAIFLKPGVNLHLDDGAVLLGSTNKADYPQLRTRIEGHFEVWLPALVNADKVDHLRITGPGTLDGHGAPFWQEFRTRYQHDPKTTNLAVERPRLMFIQNSDDVQISGLRFKDSGFWNLHLYRCRHVVVENSRFQVPGDARCPSSDGTDIDSCQYVTVRHCGYSVDDDCICLKGSKGPFAGADTNSPPVEHIHITGCTFERGSGVVTLGSEATIIRDVVVENCQVSVPDNQVPIVLARLKLRPDTAQTYADIHFRNITLADTAGVILQMQPWKQYFDLQGQPPPKSFVHNVTLSNINGQFGSFGNLVGKPGQTEISDITLENITVQLKHEQLKAVAVKHLKIKQVTANGKPLVVETTE